MNKYLRWIVISAAALISLASPIIGIGRADADEVLIFDIGVPSSSLLSNQPFLFDGLAYSSGGVLYGMSQAINGDTTSKLYTINQTTGASSLVGPLNLTAAENEVLGGLTFRADGTLWAELSDRNTSTLAQVNIGTGQANSIGVIAGFSDVSGIAFLNSALYGITFSNQLITINPATATGSLVGNLDSDMGAYGLAVRNGNLYTYDQTVDLLRQIDPATGHTLASINISAGDLVGEGDLAFRSDGVGFMSTGTTIPVPEPSTFLVLLIGLIAATDLATRHWARRVIR